MKIIGFDPGTRNCGFAIISKRQNSFILLRAGLLKFSSESMQERILQLNEALERLFCEHPDAQIAIEDIFYAHNPQSVLKLAQFRGALLLKALQHYGAAAEYTALQVKKSLTGKAKAEKIQVAFMVKKLLKISGEIRPLDITDAMAVALTHAMFAKNSALIAHDKPATAAKKCAASAAGAIPPGGESAVRGKKTSADAKEEKLPLTTIWPHGACVTPPGGGRAVTGKKTSAAQIATKSAQIAENAAQIAAKSAEKVRA